MQSPTTLLTTSTRATCAVICLCCALLLASCASPTRKDAVPTELADQSTVFNDPSIRTWDDTLSPAFLAELLTATRREQPPIGPNGQPGPLPPAYYLGISGGGADGAYGAGLLCGWTSAGTRPDFKIVTGISTGALTAPFAFLGPAYDDKLRRVYTSVRTDEIAKSRGLLAALFDDALMDTVPLRQLMIKLIDEQMIRDIAREYARGRILMVATTNLDANRGVIWNIGKIASSNDPKAIDLIHDILIASAAIPGAFPPVLIRVEIDGKEYEEMHVDGGTKAQVFLYPPTFALNTVLSAEGLQRQRIAYIIRNARLDPQWASVQRRTLSIAGRAISSLIQTQGVGDLYRIYLVLRRDGVPFNLAYIPATFNTVQKEEFDPVYMSQLFALGYERAAAPGGYPWSTRPPGFIEATGTPAADDVQAK